MIELRYNVMHTGQGQEVVMPWPDFWAECFKAPSGTIIVEPYDTEIAISNAQMAYWHAHPIAEYSKYTGESQWRSEQLLKRECGSKFFIKNLRKEERRRGRIMFECNLNECRHLFLIPNKIGNSYTCPSCGNEEIRMFFMLSKTELTAKNFNIVIENTYDFMNKINRPITMPNPKWREELDRIAEAKKMEKK